MKKKLIICIFLIVIATAAFLIFNIYIEKNLNLYYDQVEYAEFIEEGDFLIGITKKYGRKIGAIIEYNGYDKTKITIPKKVQNVPIKVIAPNVFADCLNLEKVYIADSVIYIGDGAFSGCDNLTYITIPDSVTYIGDDAFSGCDNLPYITIPDSVTYIGDGAFYFCYDLTEIHAESFTKEEWRSLSKGVDIVPKQAVIYLKDGKTDGAIVENGITYYVDTNTGDRYVADADSSITTAVIKSVVNGDPVTSIGEEAFYWCVSLTSIEIPNSVTYIGDEAFYNCNNLNAIVIPNSVTHIGVSAFENCSKLASITIPDSVISIGDRAFKECYRARSINIPKSVTSIGIDAFLDFDSLDEIHISQPKGSIPGSPWGGNIMHSPWGKLYKSSFKIIWSDETVHYQ